MAIERVSRPEPVTGAERAFEIQLGGLGGFELRPTRLFLWSGEARQGAERVLPIGGPPKSLDIPRRETELQAGSVRVRTLGNPLMTIALAGVHAVQKAVRDLEK
jgi:hypothetical protein